MWTRFSTPSPPRRRPPARPAKALALLLIAASAGCGPRPVRAQQIVYDPKNHVENALQAARQLQSLANEASQLANQARQLAASPYSHLGQTSQTLREIGELAKAAKGISADVATVQQSFQELYPSAVDGLDPRQALRQSQARTAAARETAQDLARTAAELERLAAGRPGRLEGAVNASQAAPGETAAIQSSTQVLAVLAEDLGSMRSLLSAQSRLLAEEAARRAADRAVGAEARRRFWSHDAGSVPPPQFEPFPNGRR